MIYLTGVIREFLVVAFIAGMMLALFPRRNLFKSCIGLLEWIFYGLGAGTVLFLISKGINLHAVVNTVLASIGLLGSILLFIWFNILQKKNRGPSVVTMARSIVFLFSLIASYKLYLFLSYGLFSSVSVLNTALVANVASLLIAVILLIALIPALAHLLISLNSSFKTSLLCLILTIVSMQWIADITLGLMKINLWGVSSAKVSFVAKIGYLFPWMIYLEIILFGLSILFFFVKKRESLRTEGVDTNIERRLSHQRILVEKRWIMASCLILMGILGPLLYQDLYASRAPKLSQAMAVQADTDGWIHIRVSDVNDGELHRFSTTTKSGQKVRFFLINKGQGSIGVALDACTMCADKGYIKKGRHVICLACGSVILIPSIGRVGGCNPIPLKHEIKNGIVLINQKDLDEGAKYFKSF